MMKFCIHSLKRYQRAIINKRKRRAVNHPRNLRLAPLSTIEGCHELDNPSGATNPRINFFFGQLIKLRYKDLFYKFLHLPMFSEFVLWDR